MKLVITIPAYNEAGTIGKVIEDIKQVFRNKKEKINILVVDDGSTDGTAKVAKKAGAKVISHPHNYGLAEAFRTEMKEALEIKPDVIVHTDADGQYKAEEIPKLLEPIENKEADLVLGSRFLGKIEEMPFIKRWGNRAFSKVISRITHVKITDGQTGFRAFTSEVASKTNVISTHTYTQEMIIRAVKEKFSVKEIPITFAKRKSGKSKLISNPLGYAVRAWINIFRIYRDFEPLKFFGKIAAIFIVPGVLLGLFMVFLFLKQGYVGHIPSTILSMLLVISGLQILIFGFLADMKN